LCKLRNVMRQLNEADCSAVQSSLFVAVQRWRKIS
jgi:hypothetical protein